MATQSVHAPTDDREAKEVVGGDEAEGRWPKPSEELRRPGGPCGRAEAHHAGPDRHGEGDGTQVEVLGEVPQRPNPEDGGDEACGPGERR